MNTQEIDRIQCAIRHIQTSVDVDPWAMEIAVDAMEKQIPKKPKKSIDVYSKDLYKLNCPACGKYIAYVNSRFGTLYKWIQAPDRCGYCGQAVDFSEWEEGEG